MSDKPIIFSTKSVQDILADRKTCTRRPLKTLVKKYRGRQPLDIIRKNKNEWIGLMQRDPNQGIVFKCRYGKIGDNLWVKETWMPWHEEDKGYCIKFKSDDWMDFWGKRNGIKVYDNKWHSSIHMLRWASRITLEITDIRVERLQDKLVWFIEFKKAGLIN